IEPLQATTIQRRSQPCSNGQKRKTCEELSTSHSYTIMYTSALYTFEHSTLENLKNLAKIWHSSRALTVQCMYVCLVVYARCRPKSACMRACIYIMQACVHNYACRMLI